MIRFLYEDYWIFAIIIVNFVGLLLKSKLLLRLLLLEINCYLVEIAERLPFRSQAFSSIEQTLKVKPNYCFIITF
jgi:hypothetical protein